VINLRKYIAIALLCLIGLAAMEVHSMSLLKGEKVCVASGFEGRLTLNGQPASGARVVRKIEWKGNKEKTEETIADKDGRFGFPVHWDVLRQVLPVQFVAYQSIFVYFQGQKYQIWETGKLDESEYGEFNGKPQNFRCELIDELRSVDLKYGFVATNCYWECAE
jgi:hypothetical protein